MTGSESSAGGSDASGATGSGTGSGPGAEAGPGAETGSGTGTGAESGGELERSLGLLDCVLLSVGGMVGSAIFVFPGTTGQLIGPASILAWVAAGVLISAIALVYTELSLAFPRAGGPAVFPYETFGSNRTVRAFASYLEGVSYSIGWAFAITVSALAIADYAAVIVPAAGGATVPIAVAAIVLAGGVNLVGVDFTSRTNLVLSLVLLAVLVIFVALGVAAADVGNYRPFLTGAPVQFFAAVNVAITGYGAWTAIPSAAEEIERPGRTIPRAILLSLLVTALLYAGVVAAIHGLIPGSAFVEGSAVATRPLSVAAESLGVPVFQRYVLPFAAIAAIFTTMLVGTLSAGRVLFALGRNGTLPRAFASVNERFGVPWLGIVAISALAGAFAAFPQYFYQLLVVAAVVGTGIPYAINVLSFVGLRRYRPDVTSPFRAPGGYWLALVAFAALAVAMVGLGVTAVVWSVGAVALIAGYFVVRHLRHADALETSDGPAR